MIKKYQKKPKYVEAMLITEHLYDWIVSKGRNKCMEENKANPAEMRSIHIFALPELPQVEFKYNWWTDGIQLKQTNAIIKVGDYIWFDDYTQSVWNAGKFEEEYVPVPPPFAYEPIPLTPEE